MKHTFRMLLIGLLAGLSLAAVLFFSWRRASEEPARVNVSRAAVIKEIRALGRLETASYTIEKVIEAGQAEGRFRSILFGDRLLLIAHGEVIAGFDLTTLGEDAVRVSGDALFLRLPPPQILVSNIDNAKTRVFDRDQGLLTHGDKDLEAEARQAAEVSIRQAACDANILDEASENARKQFRTLFQAAGFSEVTVETPTASC